MPHDPLHLADVTAAVDAMAICACATALPAHSALIRLSGPGATAIARRAGLAVPTAWSWSASSWTLGPGGCPVRALFAPAGRSFTGEDLVEITLPGAPDLVALALAALAAAGAQAAQPGGFARQALANGRIGLDQAEAMLALAAAGDAAAARRALDRLAGALSAQLLPARGRLLAARARVEAGLDFAGEEGVAAYDPAQLRDELSALRVTCARWAGAARDLGDDPVVCLVGPANAGKSALFAHLTGEPALISPVAGTTRDWLVGTWSVGGRALRLIDTAGWLDARDRLDRAAIAAGRAAVTGAALVLACSAPDARLPADPGDLPPGTLVVATKSDLGQADARAMVAVSVVDGSGLDTLASLVAGQLSGAVASEPRQARLLAEVDAVLAELIRVLPSDELLAEDLRRASAILGDLLGQTTADEVLDGIFARFCIGK